MHGGFYVEGINGVINSERDLTSGKRADDGTWEVGIDYNHGQMVLCTGMFCSADDRVTPKPVYVPAHTCAAVAVVFVLRMLQLRGRHAKRVCGGILGGPHPAAMVTVMPVVTLMTAMVVVVLVVVLVDMQFQLILEMGWGIIQTSLIVLAKFTPRSGTGVGS